MKKPLLQKLAPLIGIALFAVAAWVLHRALRQHNIKDILRLMRELPASRLLPAFGLTAVSYLTLTFYDAFAFRFIKRVLPWRRHTAPPAEEVSPLISAYRLRHPKAPVGLISRRER